jgi:preprotein translocase subunit SecG
MWQIFLTTLHIVVCIFLVVVVLLQTGKGSDISAVFGGSSQTIFGSSGAGNFLTKLTTATAIIFMFTSLTLTYGVARQATQSVFDEAPTSTPTPEATEQAPAGQLEQPGTSGEKQGEAAAPTSATTPSAPAATPQPSAESTSSSTAPATPKTPEPQTTAPSSPTAKTP